MQKTLTQEVAFGGKAVARITVSAFPEKVSLDGDYTGSEKIITNATVEIVFEGKVVESGFFADVLEFNNITDTFYIQAGLDVNTKYTRVGGNAMTKGAEAGLAINAAIAAMKAELAQSFNVETEAEIEKREEIEEAQAVVDQAQREGVEKLMSATEIESWRNRYNEMYNEGGEGYIPDHVSLEQYQWALKVLA